MNRMNIVAVSLALVLGVGPAMAASSNGPSAERGRKIFANFNCIGCHGTVGQGSFSGAKLAPDPLPLDAMINFIRTVPARMPAYSAAVLSDADIADIHAYLATIPKAPSPDSIPALKGLKDTP